MKLNEGSGGAVIPVDSEGRIIYNYERVPELELDAKRYRWLRDTMTIAVGGGVEVNDQKLVYEEVPAGEAVRLYWYPDTPVGFHEVKADTLDAAIDAAMEAK